MAQTDCPICGGSGWKLVERTTPGAQALASPETARPGTAMGEPKMVWAVPCDCTRANPTDRAERALSRARIPERYRLCCFDSFETDFEYPDALKAQIAAWNRSLSNARFLVRKFVQEFPACEDRGLILMGNCGVGKTHLAVAALKEIVSKGHYGLFYDYGELLKLIQGTYHPDTDVREMDILDPVLNCELLLLDDLGSSKPGMWALETVGHILTRRYNEKRFTLITTNYLDADSRLRPQWEDVTWSDRPRGKEGALPKEGPPPDVSRSHQVIRTPSGELIPRYAPDTFEQRVGARIRSRLYEMCVTVEIDSDDRRKYINKDMRPRRALGGV